MQTGREFLVEWKGDWPGEQFQWVQQEDLGDAKSMLQAFYNRDVRDKGCCYDACALKVDPSISLKCASVMTSHKYERVQYTTTKKKLVMFSEMTAAWPVFNAVCADANNNADVSTTSNTAERRLAGCTSGAAAIL